MNNKIENIFKEKFTGYESTPHSDLFETIQLKRAKNKHVQWYWATAGLISLVIIISVTYVLKVEKKTVTPQPLHQIESVMPKNTLNSQVSEDNEKTKEQPETSAVKRNTNVNVTYLEKKLLNSESHASKVQDPSSSQDNTAPHIVNQKLAEKFKELYSKDKNVDPSAIRIFTTKGEIDVDRSSITTPNIIGKQNASTENKATLLPESDEEETSETISVAQKTKGAKEKKKIQKNVGKKISKLKHSRNRKSQKYRLQNNSYPKI
jgi:hypothetical protein